jgi:hypothetical protein
MVHDPDGADHVERATQVGATLRDLAAAHPLLHTVLAHQLRRGNRALRRAVDDERHVLAQAAGLAGQASVDGAVVDLDMEGDAEGEHTGNTRWAAEDIAQQSTTQTRHCIASAAIAGPRSDASIGHGHDHDHDGTVRGVYGS